MPRYATLQDLDDQGYPLSAFAGIDKSMQQRVLDRASAYCDGFLADSITLPIVGAPDPALVVAVCQIAAWWLLARRGFDPSNAGDQVVRQGFLDANDWLRRVANKQVKLQVLQTSPESLQPNVASNAPRGYGDITGAGATDEAIVPGFSNWGS